MLPSRFSRSELKRRVLRLFSSLCCGCLFVISQEVAVKFLKLALIVWLKMYYVESWTELDDSGTRTPRAEPESSITFCIVERELSCFIFVPLPTLLIKFENSGSFHWASTMFLYFCSISGLSRSCCRWPDSENIFRSRHSPDFVR